MKIIKSSKDFKKEYNKILFYDNDFKEYINASLKKNILDNISVHRNLLSSTKDAVKKKYFFDRIRCYENYLDSTKLRPKIGPMIAFYSSTTNLINNANYLLRLNYISKILKDKNPPLIFFLEDSIFHSKKEFKIDIIPGEVFLDVNQLCFFSTKEKNEELNSKLKQKISSFIQKSKIENKDWLKERYFANMDFLFSLVSVSISKEEFMQRLAIECLMQDKFNGVIALQSDLVKTILKRINLRDLLENNLLNIDINVCPNCKKSHVGPFKSTLGEIILPCGNTPYSELSNLQIRFKKALLPFFGLHCMGLIPALSRQSYLEYFDQLEKKNHLIKSKIVIVFGKINYLSLFFKKMTYANLLSEGNSKDQIGNKNFLGNKKNKDIKNEDYYLMHKKEFSFLPANRINISDPTVYSLIKNRESEREKSNWSKSDRIREDLLIRGIEVKDTLSGTLFRTIA